MSPASRRPRRQHGGDQNAAIRHEPDAAPARPSARRRRRWPPGRPPATARRVPLGGRAARTGPPAMSQVLTGRLTRQCRARRVRTAGQLHWGGERSRRRHRGSESARRRRASLRGTRAGRTVRHRIVPTVPAGRGDGVVPSVDICPRYPATSSRGDAVASSRPTRPDRAACVPPAAARRLARHAQLSRMTQVVEPGPERAYGRQRRRRRA